MATPCLGRSSRLHGYRLALRSLPLPLRHLGASHLQNRSSRCFAGTPTTPHFPPPSSAKAKPGETEKIRSLRGRGSSRLETASHTPVRRDEEEEKNVKLRQFVSSVFDVGERLPRPPLACQRTEMCENKVFGRPVVGGGPGSYRMQKRSVVSLMQMLAQKKKKKGVAQPRKKVQYISTPDPLAQPIKSRDRRDFLHASSSASSLSSAGSPHEEPGDPFILNDIHEREFAFREDMRSSPNSLTSPGVTQVDKFFPGVDIRRTVVPARHRDAFDKEGAFNEDAEERGRYAETGVIESTSTTAHRQLRQLAQMRSVKHLASYLLQFSQTVPAANSAEAYVQVLSRLERDAGLMDCEAIRRAATAIANFRRGRNSPLASKTPRRLRPYDGQRGRSSPRETTKTRKEQEAAELRGLLAGGQRQAGIFAGDLEPEVETNEAVRVAEDRTVEALMKQAGEQLLDTTPLRTACRLLALFAVYFRLFYLPFYAGFSLKFCQQHLRASGQELADVAHAFALLYLKDGRLFESVATASASILSTFSHTHLSRLLLSFALVGLSCESLFLDAAPHIARMRARFSPEEVGHLAFAHARFRLCTPQLQSLLNDRVPDILPYLSSPQLGELVISMRQLRVPLSLDAQAQLAERIDLSVLDWELLGAFLSAASLLQALPISFWQEAATECLSRLLPPLTSMEMLAATEWRTERDATLGSCEYNACGTSHFPKEKEFESASQQMEVSCEPVTSWLSPSMKPLSAALSSPVVSSAASQSAQKDFALPPDFPILPLPSTSALVDCFLSFSALFAGSLAGSAGVPHDLCTPLPSVLAALAHCLCSSPSLSSTSEEDRNGGSRTGPTRKELIDTLLPADVARLYRALRGGVRSHWDVEQRQWKEAKEGPEHANASPQSMRCFDPFSGNGLPRRRVDSGKECTEETQLRGGPDGTASSLLAPQRRPKSDGGDVLAEAPGAGDRHHVDGESRQRDVAADGEEEAAWMETQVNSLRYFRKSGFSRGVTQLNYEGRSPPSRDEVSEQASSDRELGSVFEFERDGETEISRDPSALWTDTVVARALHAFSNQRLDFNVRAEAEGEAEASEGSQVVPLSRALSEVADALTSGEGQDAAILRLEMGLLRRFLSLEPGAFSLSQLLAVTYSLIALYPPPARPVASTGSLVSLPSLSDGVNSFPSSISARRTKLQSSRTEREGAGNDPPSKLPARSPLPRDAPGAFLEVACRRVANALCTVQKKEGTRDDEACPPIQHLLYLQQFVVRTFTAVHYPGVPLWPLPFQAASAEAVAENSLQMRRSQPGGPRRLGFSFASPLAISEVESILEEEGIEFCANFGEGPFTCLGVETSRPIAYLFLAPECYQPPALSASSRREVVRRVWSVEEKLKGQEESGELAASYRHLHTSMDTKRDTTDSSHQLEAENRNSCQETENGRLVDERNLYSTAIRSADGLLELKSETGAALRCFQQRGWQLVCLPFFVWRLLATREAKRSFLRQQRELCLAVDRAPHAASRN
ncbi:hypothetical protein TGP89_295590 [Toxoplasma gondii p89]|uniref:RAP domain-containing protein n=3 Tax=Toxoplasma gondii TaxID=5811 RepID=A0A086J894_TOXGO|nr:hypothetical protein TGP89_295590 [Toxoplasma gondii p89]